MYKHTWHVAPDGANHYLVALAINMLLLLSKDSEPSRRIHLLAVESTGHQPLAVRPFSVEANPLFCGHTGNTRVTSDCLPLHFHYRTRHW